MSTEYMLRPIGIIRSQLQSLDDCPLQGSEGAPEAWIDIGAQFKETVKDLQVGEEVILLTWLHRANRDVLKCIRRKEFGTPEVGVFSTRSPDRPNPIGLHRVRIEEINGSKLRVTPLEALDGTPVLDIKPVLGDVRNEG